MSLAPDTPSTDTEGMDADKLLGKTATLIVRPMSARSTDDDLLVKVTIVETRSSYGRTDVRVSPVAGKGKQWVQLDRLQGIK